MISASVGSWLWSVSPQRGLSAPLLFLVKVAGEELQCEKRDAESEIYLMAREAVDEGNRRAMLWDNGWLLWMLLVLRFACRGKFMEAEFYERDATQISYTGLMIYFGFEKIMHIVVCQHDGRKHVYYFAREITLAALLI